MSAKDEKVGLRIDIGHDWRAKKPDPPNPKQQLNWNTEVIGGVPNYFHREEIKFKKNEFRSLPKITLGIFGLSIETGKPVGPHEERASIALHVENPSKDGFTLLIKSWGKENAIRDVGFSWIAIED
ncbi:MAG: H-type lectin domain-containing protein [Pyrinomonadaceae bacterium]|nr:H-type lectin domain-containing protein [Pyrinomonadaceae bacterium]